jgi:hypothetical protein
MTGILAARFENRKSHAAKFGHMITHLFGRLSQSSDQPGKIRFQLGMLAGIVSGQQVKRRGADDGETAHEEF